MGLHNGNCQNEDVMFACRKCGIGNLCDVCHGHDVPRGDCETCATDCPACVGPVEGDRARRTTGGTR